MDELLQYCKIIDVPVLTNMARSPCLDQFILAHDVCHGDTDHKLALGGNMKLAEIIRSSWTTIDDFLFVCGLGIKYPIENACSTKGKQAGGQKEKEMKIID